MTAAAIMGLLPDGLRATGSILFHGKQLLVTPEREMSRLRGNDLAMVFEEPMTALNSLTRAGKHVRDPLLESVGLPGVADRHTALLFITHDLAVVARVCERLLVMYEGRIVEEGPVRDHTRRLLAASDLEAA